MKLTGKVVTLVAASLMMVHVACPALQKIVAYKAKGMNTTIESKIILRQKDDKIVSSATFKAGTDKSGTKFGTETKKKYLYFQENEPLRITFYNNATQGGELATIFPPTGTSALDGGKILKNSKIKISGTAHPYTIEIEPPLVKIKVKNEQPALTDSMRIYALKENKDTGIPPAADNVYDSILVSNLRSRTLKVPSGKTFWISIDNGQGQMLTPSEISATLVKPSSVITIDANAKATLTK